MSVFEFIMNVLGDDADHLEEYSLKLSLWWMAYLPPLTLKNYVAWIHDRTVPTELQPLFGEVSANFCGSAWRIPMAVFGFPDRSSYFSSKCLNCSHEVEWTLFQKP
jgi:hypothetical protein